MAVDRQRAAHRLRRIIFNDDAGSLHREPATTPEAFLADRLDHVVGTQVDSVWWSFMTGAEGGPAWSWLYVISRMSDVGRRNDGQTDSYLLDTKKPG